MRIISGTYRGKQIIAPRNLQVRPTTGFAKEALFSILNNKVDFERIHALDLFAGTGNISYEMVSRGVPQIIAVDANFPCVRFINQTAEKLEMTGLQAIKADALQFVNRAYQKWDVIFADPPYDYGSYVELIDTILSKNILKEGGILIIEHGSENNFSEHPKLKDHRKYGHVQFSFF
jgi:16S rRNA (guanine(966)-N(2))-methyltransferase RsmD